MPARPQKTVTIFGLLGDVEASYGGGGALTGADHAILLAEPSVATLEYLFGGERNPNAGAGGTLERTTPVGRSATLPVGIEARGRGSAYSGTDVAKDLDVLLRIAGHSATFSATPTPQWTYAPIQDNIESGVFEAYSRGQKYDITAANAVMSFAADGPGFGRFSFDLSGLSPGLPTDVALPALTVDNTTKPPTAKNMLVTIGGFAAGIVRSVNFNSGRPIDPRADINADGHAGFALGPRGATTELVLEATPLTVADPWTSASDLNPYALRDNATTFAFSFQLGSVQYNRIVFSMPLSQVVGVAEGEDGSVATWTLTLEHHQSAPGANDEYSIVLN